MTCYLQVWREEEKTTILDGYKTTTDNVGKVFKKHTTEVNFAVPEVRLLIYADEVQVGKKTRLQSLYRTKQNAEERMLKVKETQQH